MLSRLGGKGLHDYAQISLDRIRQARPSAADLLLFMSFIWLARILSSTPKQPGKRLKGAERA